MALMERKFILLLWIIFIHGYGNAAVNSKDVLRIIQNASTPGPPVARAPGGGDAGVPSESLRNDHIRRLQEEAQAAYELKATCDGRFNVLRFDLQRTVTRSEWVSLTGGLFGVFGAVATCPHCAAIGAGIAGLANPLQQTFRDNEDSPENYRAKLIALSERINSELEEYRRLAPADPDSKDFEVQLRTRLDALLTITASCQYYEAHVAVEGTKK